MNNIIKSALIIISVFLSSQFVIGQSFESASSEFKLDLENSLSELAEIRKSIAKEKVPLLKRINKLEVDIREKSKKLDRALRFRDNRDMDLIKLKNSVKALNDQNDYAASLLDEFVRTFETRIDFSETQLYREYTEEARLILDDPDASQADKFTKQIEVIETALDRLNDLIGGYTFKGKALEPEGEIIDGTFAAFGPAVYFNSNDDSIQGITINKLNSAEAAIAVPGEGYEKQLLNLFKSGEGEIPADVTLGKALKIVEGNDTILEHLAKGGSVGIVIISLGILCLLLGSFKAYEIFNFKTPASKKVQKVLQAIEDGNTNEAKNAASKIDGVGGEILVAGIENHNTNRANLEEILYEKILAVQPNLERFLPFMALTAAAAPLLGLLGTVTGMIKTFNLITIFGTGDAKSLSSGISEALVTTELGLCVAIPSLIFHGLLSRMAKQKIGDLEQLSISFINGVTGNKNT